MICWSLSYEWVKRLPLAWLILAQHTTFYRITGSKRRSQPIRIALNRVLSRLLMEETGSSSKGPYLFCRLILVVTCGGRRSLSFWMAGNGIILGKPWHSDNPPQIQFKKNLAKLQEKHITVTSPWGVCLLRTTVKKKNGRLLNLCPLNRHDRRWWRGGMHHWQVRISSVASNC